ncbi:MAG: biopolymer transporter ExbD [Saprospiraceae bacterium]|nr:biopolymer transporter ExbD [Saprospiraceae bacterium]MCC7506000.1 biopolymer transporter ExbD [Saprospiraceae bacterium]
MGLKRRQRVEPEFSLAAMIDVIFLLLMFFMLTSKFVTPNALNLTLPSSTATTMASPNFAVSIDKAGAFYLDRTQTPEANLENAIAARMKAMNKEPQDVTVTVVAEKGVPIENVVFVLDIANRLKVKTILATDPKAEPTTK